jgi:hypothetical protein
MRKTIDRAVFLKHMNKLLSLPLVAEPGERLQMGKEEKAVVCTATEAILMDHDSYRGFSWNLPLEEARAVTPDDDTYYNRFYY